MTVILTISDDDGNTPFDFYSGLITLSQDSWQDSGDQISFTLTGKGATSLLLAEFQTLEDLLNAAALYTPDGLRGNAVWLNQQTDGDIVTRQRCILTVSRPQWAWSNGGGINPLLTTQTIKFNLTLFMASVDWENEAESEITVTTLDALGGTYNFQTTKQGTAEGRIKSLRLDTLNQPGLITRLWIGIRPKRDGLTDFVNVWAASAGDNGTSTAGAADANCDSGNRKTVTYSAGSLVRRTTIVYDDVNGALDSTHLRGHYLVLMRYAIAADNTAWEVQLRYGYSGGSQAALEPQIVSRATGSTTYQVVEMGTVQFPPSNDRGLVTNFDECAMSIYAGGISGTGNLHLGELILIPTEHLIRVDGASIGPSTGNFETTIYTHPSGEVYGYGYDIVPNTTVKVDAENWLCPYEPCALYLAAAQGSALVLSDTIAVSMVIHRRYRNYAI